MRGAQILEIQNNSMTVEITLQKVAGFNSVNSSATLPKSFCGGSGTILPYSSPVLKAAPVKHMEKKLTAATKVQHLSDQMRLLITQMLRHSRTSPDLRYHPCLDKGEGLSVRSSHSNFWDIYGYLFAGIKGLQKVLQKFDPSPWKWRRPGLGSELRINGW